MLTDYRKKTANLKQQALNKMLAEAGFKREMFQGKERLIRKWQGSQSTVIALVKKRLNGLYCFTTVAVPKVESKTIRGINDDA